MKIIQRLSAGLLLVACLILPAQAAVIGGGGGGLGTIPQSTVANLPANPAAGTVRIVTDGASATDCGVGGGSTRALCDYNGAAWNALSGGSGVTGWPSSSTTKEITWANNLANAARIGNGTTPWCIYTDATDGPQLRPCTDANVRTIIPTNFTWALYDVEGASAIETVDPDAASPNAIWTYASAYRPRKSIWFGAGSLSTDGTQCAAPAEVTINSGPKIWTIICTDNDASTIHGSIRMPDAWDGGTVTLTHVYIQTAVDTGVLNGDIAAQCRGNGEALTSTYGTEVAIDDAAVVGSNSNDMTTSAAVTATGTCAAGDMLYWRYQLDAIGTTTAVATLHHVGFNLEYTVSSRSD